MKNHLILLFLLAISVALLPGCGESANVSAQAENGEITLPEPQKDSDTSIEEALLGRRSVRDFSEGPVTLEQISQLFWAAQGINRDDGGRTAPSAGALYPLTVYVVIGNADGILPGLYKYEPEGHKLTRVLEGDLRQPLSQAALGQPSVRQAAVDFVITGKYEIITPKYGERGIMYTFLEAGHAAQNICLQAVGLKLGVVTIGAFDDAGVRQVLGLSADETPLYIIPAGNY